MTAGDVQLGAIERKNLPMLVADQGLRQSLLGMNFIGSLSGFDVRGDRMILQRLGSFDAVARDLNSTAAKALCSTSGPAPGLLASVERICR